MKGKKVMALLEECAGNASTSELRLLAKKKFPNSSLHRTLHTTLKELQKDGVLLYDEDLKHWIIPQLTPSKVIDSHGIETPGLAIRDLPPEMEQKKVILKVSEEEVREKMNQFEINPNAFIAKKEPNFDSDSHSIYYQGEDKKYSIDSDHERYRDKHEIVMSILTAIAQGRTKTTAIMYRCFLSHYQLKRYLDMLIKNELIVSTGKTTYEMTRKGYEFMDAMKKVSELKFD